MILGELGGKEIKCFFWFKYVRECYEMMDVGIFGCVCCGGVINFGCLRSAGGVDLAAEPRGFPK